MYFLYIYAECARTGGKVRRRRGRAERLLGHCALGWRVLEIPAGPEGPDGLDGLEGLEVPG